MKSHFYLWALESWLSVHAEVQSGLWKSDVEINSSTKEAINKLKINIYKNTNEDH
jgi:hypothetical protein